MIKNMKYIHSSYEKHGVVCLRQCSVVGSIVGRTCKGKMHHECSVAMLLNFNLMGWTKICTCENGVSCWMQCMVTIQSKGQSKMMSMLQSATSIWMGECDKCCCKVL